MMGAMIVFAFVFLVALLARDAEWSDYTSAE